MTIKSDFLTFGLFGQVFGWMLEILPHLEQYKLRPAWEIRTKHYGEPPEFNIFPGVIETAYPPDAEPTGELSLEELKQLHGTSYGGDFHEAHRCWNAFFRFPQEVTARLEAFCREQFAGETVLGVHFRGTDKNTALWETNPVSHEAFLAAVDDFLGGHPEVTKVFVATDDARFLEAIARRRPVLAHTQQRSEDGGSVWNGHAGSRNVAMARDAVLDCLTLSRCRFVLKGMSALSAFAKVMNPGLEAYRISACKRDWFPEAFIPLYRGRTAAARRALAPLQRDDVGFKGAARFFDKVGKRLDRWRLKN